MPGRLRDFVDEWRRLVVPLRRQFGFEVLEAWASEEDDTFAWLLAFHGEDFAAADAAYYESAERMALEPDPARLVKRIVATTLVAPVELR